MLQAELRIRLEIDRIRIYDPRSIKKRIRIRSSNKNRIRVQHEKKQTYHAYCLTISKIPYKLCFDLVNKYRDKSLWSGSRIQHLPKYLDPATSGPATLAETRLLSVSITVGAIFVVKVKTNYCNRQGCRYVWNWPGLTSKMNRILIRPIEIHT